MIKSQLGTQVKNQDSKIHPPGPQPFRSKQTIYKANLKQEAADLGLRLMNRDNLSQNDLQQLAKEVQTFVSSMLRKNNKDIIEDFVIKHKDHFTSEIKDLIGLEISLMGGK